MRVRMTQQINGEYATGKPWPAAGEEVDLPDDVAHAAIRNGTAVDPANLPDKVLVPPAGIHTPGTTAASAGTQAFVRAPADASADPEGVRQALRDAEAGNFVEGSTDIGHQHADGSALTDDETRKREEQAAHLAAAPEDTGKTGT